jgi:hypothetical protein
MTHRKMPPAVQLAIVKMLACYQTPTEVAQAIKAEFGIKVSRQNVNYYDATHSEEVAPQLKEYFYDQRRKFLAQLDRLPIESRAHRQRCRQRLYYKNEKNPKIALSILDSGAKEAGGHYTSVPKVRKLGI